jgi:hypothetical protein
MIEAVDGFKGLWGGEGERVGAGAENWAVFLVQVLLDDVQTACQVVVEFPVGSVRKVVGGRGTRSSTYQTLLMLAKNGPG